MPSKKDYLDRMKICKTCKIKFTRHVDNYLKCSLTYDGWSQSCKTCEPLPIKPTVNNIKPHSTYRDTYMNGDDELYC